jgi:thiol-disulfide isomerase/thioredoxin
MTSSLIRRLAVAGGLAVAVTASPLAGQESGIMIGATAPTRTLTAADGRVTNLGDVIGKRPVLLEFWATWCPSCKELEPHLVSLHRQHGDKVAFFVIAVPINQTLARVQRYAQDRKYPFPVLWDKDGELAADYEAPATSYVVLIDKAGKVVYTGSGGSQDLATALRKVL